MADSFTPPNSVARAAQAARRRREAVPLSQRGLTGVGSRRMGQLAGRKPVSVKTLRRMVGYFSRHLRDKRASTWAERGRGWVAWHAWGGDAGARWALRTLRKADRDWYDKWARSPRNRALIRHLRGK